MNGIIKFFNKPLLALALAACVAGLFFGGMRHMRTVVAEAAAVARAECNSHWRAQLAEANAEALGLLSRQKDAALIAQAIAQDEILSLKLQLEGMEAENAQIADRCGLGRERVLLLNRQAGDRKDNVAAPRPAAAGAASVRAPAQTSGAGHDGA